ncbi:ABC transporter ATP-binding protein [candidate division CSSED10-310 bacterium]|uniref:ABC transporter ATP-binding protein n=1 Tax=candidate division CSSED10-310 bacterium TaxID=2855610 RepID=A0ABV6YT54_UNCC1
MIKVEDLVKEYGSLRAVDKLSFDIKKGEILGLVGPNGAGKTTTLRCMVGIIPPSAGQIFIAGYDLLKQPIDAKQRLAFIPDEPRLFDYLTVWDHILLFSRLYGVTDGHLRGGELLQEFDLFEKRDAFPSELSRGMKQKAVIALALLHRPEVLILDEPLTGLDPTAMHKMKQTISKTAAQGVSVVVSSHMLDLIEEISSSIIIIQKGKKLLEGSMDVIRKAVPDLTDSADLEDIFIRATNNERNHE